MMKSSGLVFATFISAFTAHAALAHGDGGHGEKRGGSPMMANMSFAEVDANGDGEITLLELKAWRAAKQAKADVDGDGFLSAEEIVTMHGREMSRKAERMYKHMLKKLDANDDGQLALSEMDMSDQLSKMFGKLDADSNELLSEAELEAGIKGLHKKRKGWWKKFWSDDDDDHGYGDDS